MKRPANEKRGRIGGAAAASKLHQHRIKMEPKRTTYLLKGGKGGCWTMGRRASAG